MHQKRHVYARNGVPEYIVLLAYEQQVIWFALRAGVYEEITPDDAGILRSEVFAGLWLDPDALRAGDLAETLAVLQQGTESDEH